MNSQLLVPAWVQCVVHHASQLADRSHVMSSAVPIWFRTSLLQSRREGTAMSVAPTLLDSVFRFCSNDNIGADGDVCVGMVRVRC